MVMRRFVEFALGFIMILAVATMLLPGVCGAGSSEAKQRIDDGEAALANAFKAVADAETAGANVSALISQLNETASHLGLADVAYADDDFDEALNSANECVSLANSVSGDAIELKDQATAAASMQWMTVLFSVVGAIVFGFVLYGVWVWFQRYHSQKILGLRPEVEG
jgi:hypothetical protein